MPRDTYRDRIVPEVDDHGVHYTSDYEQHPNEHPFRAASEHRVKKYLLAALWLLLVCVAALGAVALWWRLHE